MMSREERLARLERLRAEKVRRDQTEVKRALSAAERASTDFVAFCEYVIKDERTGQPIKLAEIHHMWIQFMALCWRLNLFPYILAPFGAGKTTIPGIALPLYLLGQDPSLRIKIISAKDDLATERVEVIRQYIDESEEYHEVFPNVVRDPNKKWTAHKIFVKRPTRAKDASVQALGATATSIGGRSDFNVYDDLNDMKNTILQPKMRKTVHKQYTTVFHSRLESPPRGAGIMTRWHVEDNFGMITKDPSMARQYGFLIQAVNEDLTALDCEIILGADPRLAPPRPAKGRNALDRALIQYEDLLLAA
jgi:hypothetical protein